MSIFYKIKIGKWLQKGKIGKTEQPPTLLLYVKDSVLSKLFWIFLGRIGILGKVLISNSSG